MGNKPPSSRALAHMGGIVSESELGDANFNCKTARPNARLSHPAEAADFERRVCYVRQPNDQVWSAGKDMFRIELSIPIPIY